MKQTPNKSFNNVVIISQAMHHLEKSIFIRERVFKNAKILNFHQNITKLKSIEETFEEDDIEHFASFDQLDFGSLEGIEILIFFSFSPTLPLIEFIKKIREYGKKIVLFQDNHQFSIHKGSFNSAILRPDLIIAASDLEKKFLKENLLFDEEAIISSGWLFQESNEKLESKIDKDKTKKILIVFSAPFSIALLSDETYTLRKEIIFWAIRNFPDHDLLIKLHPHENSTIFKNFIKKYNINYSLLPSQGSINEAILLGDIIVCSNISQSPLDVISTDIEKRLILYYFKTNNFLLEQDQINDKKSFSTGNPFGIYETKLSQRKKIKEEHLKLDQNVFENIKERITKFPDDINSRHSELDILLWLFIYGKSSYITDFLQVHQSKKYKNLCNLILNKEFDLHALSQDFFDPRIKDPLSIIIIRYYLNKKDIKKINIDIISKNFFSTYVFAFFFRDFIRFTNLINAKGLSDALDIRYLELIQKIENFYAFKFIFFKLFFFILRKVYSSKIKFLSLCLFLISDRILRFK